MREPVASLSLVVLGLCAVLSAAAPQSPPGPEPIPVDEEPRHRIVFTDAALRVLEVRVPAGDTTLEHRHDHDLATINVENGPTRTRDRGADWSGVRPRQVGGVNLSDYTGKPLAHVVQSVGDRAYRLTGVENLKGGGWTSFPSVSGPNLTVAGESRAFRAYELRLPAGARASHTHLVPVVVTLVEGEVTAQPGSTPALVTSGQWSVVPAGATHVVETRDGARVVEIEVR